MARTHARVLVSITSDPDFLELSPATKWAYVQMLAQPKLTLVGSLDYMPTRWAKAFDGGTVDGIETAIAELEKRQFVVIDHDTAELLIRTFVRHDFNVVGRNWKLIKGIWGAWERLESSGIRQIALDHMPDAIWEVNAAPAPAAALRMRRSEGMEPKIDLEIGPKIHLPSDLESELSCIQKPSNSILQTASFRESHVEAKPDPSPPDTDEAKRLAELLADLIADHGVKRPNVTPTWITEMDRLMRIDNHTAEQVERAIRWVHQTPGNFWASNILSPAKLRKQYPALQIEAKRANGHNGHTNGQRKMAAASSAADEAIAIVMGGQNQPTAIGPRSVTP